MQADDDHMCMLRGCTENDLLAAKCRDCGKTFCSGHIKRDQHACNRNLTPPPPQQSGAGSSSNGAEGTVPCPMCAQWIPVATGASADRVVMAHIDAGCPVVVRSSPPPASSSRAVPVDAAQRLHNYCDFGDCRRNEATLILCPACHGSFCVDHRHQEAHKCRLLGSSSPAAPGGGRVLGGAPRPAGAPRGAPVTATAAPSAPQHIGSRDRPMSLTAGKTYSASDAIGTYVSIRVPASLALDRRLTIVHIQALPSTPIGRLLDAACDHANVRNPNNTAATKPEDRLALWADTAAPLVPSMTLSQLTSSELVLGSSAMREQLASTASAAGTAPPSKDSCRVS